MFGARSSFPEGTSWLGINRVEGEAPRKITENVRELLGEKK
jgi:hypothetical protein